MIAIYKTKLFTLRLRIDYTRTNAYILECMYAYKQAIDNQRDWYYIVSKDSLDIILREKFVFINYQVNILEGILKSSKPEQYNNSRAIAHQDI